MFISRIESLILKQGMEDAITRAKNYIDAGTDAIMIHSKEKVQTRFLSFVKNFINLIARFH